MAQYRALLCLTLEAHTKHNRTLGNCVGLATITGRPIFRRRERSSPRELQFSGFTPGYSRVGSIFSQRFVGCARTGARTYCMHKVRETIETTLANRQYQGSRLMDPKQVPTRYNLQKLLKKVPLYKYRSRTRAFHSDGYLQLAQ